MLDKGTAGSANYTKKFRQHLDGIKSSTNNSTLCEILYKFSLKEKTSE